MLSEVAEGTLTLRERNGQSIHLPKIFSSPSRPPYRRSPPIVWLQPRNMGSPSASHLPPHSGLERHRPLRPRRLRIPVKLR